MECQVQMIWTVSIEQPLKYLWPCFTTQFNSIRLFSCLSIYAVRHPSKWDSCSHNAVSSKGTVASIFRPHTFFHNLNSKKTDFHSTSINSKYM